MIALVRQRQGITPQWPLQLVSESWLDPFGQFRHCSQCLLDQRRNPVLGQPIGQRIDRLGQLPDQRDAIGLDMIGVNDLEHLAILLKLTGDPAQFAHR